MELFMLFRSTTVILVDDVEHYVVVFGLVFPTFNCTFSSALVENKCAHPKQVSCITVVYIKQCLANMPGNFFLRLGPLFKGSSWLDFSSRNEKALLGHALDQVAVAPRSNFQSHWLLESRLTHVCWNKIVRWAYAICTFVFQKGHTHPFCLCVLNCLLIAILPACVP